MREILFAAFEGIEDAELKAYQASVNDSPQLVLAGTVVLIPRAPLVLITLFVQVIATTLLPAALVFLILLLNDEQTMGKYKNTLLQNIANIGITAMIVVVSTLYGISALFPNLLK